MTGLVVDGAGFEALAGEQRVGPRRSITPADVGLLGGLAGRHVRAARPVVFEICGPRSPSDAAWAVLRAP